MDHDSPTTPLHIGMLGGFRLSCNGMSIAGQVGPRVQSLLGWLVLHAGVPQSRERLAGLFFPDASPETARSNLRKLIYHLRQVFPDADSSISTSRISITFQPGLNVVVDIIAFREAARHADSSAEVSHAISLYGGELLPDCYDDWIIPERDELYRRYLELLDHRIELAKGAGDISSAIEYALKLLREEPLQEETYRTLMRLYDSAGNRGAAVHAYHRCASILEQELSIEPSPETRAVYTSVLGGRRQEALGVQGTETHPIREARTIPLVGRMTEREALRLAWREAMEGSPGVTLLVGEPGIGKTRLLEDMRDWQRRLGTTTAWTRCYAPRGSSSLAFAPIASLIRTLPLPQLDPIWLSELARFRPALLAERPDVLPPGPITEPWQRHRLFEAIARALLAKCPLLLVVDDLQWIDNDALQLLEYIVRFQADAQLLLIGGVRPEDKGTEDARLDLFSGLRAADRVREIDVPALVPDESAELARSVMHQKVSSEQIERIVQETEGNPLFILEMGRAGLDGASAARRAANMIEARLARLSAGAQEIAELAAVTGRAFRVPVLLAAAKDEENAVVRGLDELWRNRVIREQGNDVYDFSHDRIRNVAYERLSAARRLLLHHRIGIALEEVYSGELPRVSGDLALHFEEAQQRGKAAHYYAIAGDEARRVFSNDLALQRYRRALSLESDHDPAVLLHLGETLETVGRLSEAVDVLERAIARAGETGDSLIAIRSRIRLGRMLNLVGRQEEARTVLHRALEHAEIAGLSWELAEATRELGLLYWSQGFYEKSLGYLEQAGSLARAFSDTTSETLVLSHLGYIHGQRGQHDQAQMNLERAVSLARASNDPHLLATTLGRLAVVHFHRLELRNALQHLMEQQAIAQQIGDRRLQFAAWTNAATAYSVLDEHHAALHAFEVVLSNPALADDVAASALVAINIGAVYVRAGAHEQAVRWLGAALERTDGLALWVHVSVALGQLARAYHLQGQKHDPTAPLARARAIIESMELRFHLAEVLYFEADLLHARGVLQGARAVCAEAIRIGQEAHRLDYWFLADLLSIRLDRVSGAADTETLTARLLELLDQWPDERDQAAIHYELWRMNSGREKHRCAAADLYATIHARAPVELYRTRYSELTGQELLPTPPLPDLSPAFDPGSFDLDRTLARVDEHIASLMM